MKKNPLSNDKILALKEDIWIQINKLQIQIDKLQLQINELNYSLNELDTNKPTD